MVITLPTCRPECGYGCGEVAEQERYWVITDGGERYSFITPALALSKLMKLDVPGKIVCDNNIDISLGRSWTVLTVLPDGTWKPGNLPLPPDPEVGEPK